MKILSVIFCLMLISGACAYGADIAYYVGQWNVDGWYGEEQFEHVETIVSETAGIFSGVEQFGDDALDAFGAWAEANMNDGEMDIIWLNGCTPSCLYPYPNVEPDGSVIERWLDGGNMVINVGDWFAYCSYEGGGRKPDNGGSGAANILDLSSGIIVSADNSSYTVTPTGKKYMPSLNDPAVTYRPVVISAVVAPWEVAAIFASDNGSDDPASASRADPIVIHNTDTGGYIAFVNQAAGGPAGWIDDRGMACAELIKNWAVEVTVSVEPSSKLSTTWGEVKHFR